jgi:hypothetical protein
VVITIGAVAAVGLSGGRGALPRPAPSSARDPVRENQACEGCHPREAAEWRGSQHHTSFTDPTFQRALDVEPRAFCRGCHAPEDPDGVRGGGAQALGVGCVTCHLAGDVVLAAPRAGVALAPHRVERSPGFAGDAACAGCHEFSFGDDERRESPLPMQRTVSEHAASGASETTCADCHMPRTAGRRSHAFASTRDPESHRRAVVARAERAGESTLRIHLETRGVGHAYPTGDLFRRVTVEAEVAGPDFQRVASAEVFLARHFTTGRDRDGAPLRVEVRDDRIGAEPGAPTVVDVPLGPKASGQPITWRVSLDRVLHVSDTREAGAVVPDRILLASGEVAPWQP